MCMKIFCFYKINMTFYSIQIQFRIFFFVKLSIWHPTYIIFFSGLVYCLCAFYLLYTIYSQCKMPFFTQNIYICPNLYDDSSKYDGAKIKWKLKVKIEFSNYITFGIQENWQNVQTLQLNISKFLVHAVVYDNTQWWNEFKKKMRNKDKTRERMHHSFLGEYCF